MLSVNERRTLTLSINAGILPADDRISPMSRDDMAAVLRLEGASQQTPWNEQHFIDELNNPVASIDLYWRNDQLIGFICTWFIANEMQIQNIVTSPETRRQGIAAKLLEHVIGRNQGEGLVAIWLEVRVSNVPAIELYKRFGFTSTGVRRGYYPDGEDALLMNYQFETK